MIDKLIRTLEWSRMGDMTPRQAMASKQWLLHYDTQSGYMFQICNALAMVARLGDVGSMSWHAAALYQEPELASVQAAAEREMNTNHNGGHHVGRDIPDCKLCHPTLGHRAPLSDYDRNRRIEE